MTSDKEFNDKFNIVQGKLNCIYNYAFRFQLTSWFNPLTKETTFQINIFFKNDKIFLFLVDNLIREMSEIDLLTQCVIWTNKAVSGEVIKYFR